MIKASPNRVVEILYEFSQQVKDEIMDSQALFGDRQKESNAESYTLYLSDILQSYTESDSDRNGDAVNDYINYDLSWNRTESPSADIDTDTEFQ